MEKHKFEAWNIYKVELRSGCWINEITGSAGDGLSLLFLVVFIPRGVKKKLFFFRGCPIFHLQLAFDPPRLWVVGWRFIRIRPSDKQSNRPVTIDIWMKKLSGVIIDFDASHRAKAVWREYVDPDLESPGATAWTTAGELLQQTVAAVGEISEHESQVDFALHQTKNNHTTGGKNWNPKWLLDATRPISLQAQLSGNLPAVERINRQEI